MAANMDLLDRLLEHDAWTTQQMLLICERLSDEQLDRTFDIGFRSARITLAHIIGNMELWSDLMLGRTQRPSRGTKVSALMVRLDEAAADLASLARGVRDRNGWNETFLDTLDRPPRAKSFGGGIAHILTHSMHHRAQLIYMLRRLGVEGVPEGDALSWEEQAGSGS